VSYVSCNSLLAQSIIFDRNANARTLLAEVSVSRTLAESVSFYNIYRLIFRIAELNISSFSYNLLYEYVLFYLFILFILLVNLFRFIAMEFIRFVPHVQGEGDRTDTDQYSSKAEKNYNFLVIV